MYIGENKKTLNVYPVGREGKMIPLTTCLYGVSGDGLSSNRFKSLSNFTYLGHKTFQYHVWSSWLNLFSIAIGFLIHYSGASA